MKTVSLILRIVAILGAVACVALWFNTKGIIKQATGDMKDVEGDVLLVKSAKIPGILEEKATLNSNLNGANARILELDKNLKARTDELQSERTANTKLSREKLEETNKVRKTQIALDDMTKERDSIQAKLEATTKELIAQKESVQDTTKIDEINRKYNILESQHANLQKEYAIAKKKADLLDISEIVETVTLDPKTNVQTTVKTVRIPYVEEGQIAVVTKVEKAKKNEMIALNRGKDNGLDIGQKIQLKLEGEYIATILVEELGKDFAVASVSLKDGKPEVIEVGDSYELVPTVEFKKPAEEAAADAPAAPADDAASTIPVPASEDL